MISGLIGLKTEDAYVRARNLLKERFGDPFKVYEAYREKLATWQKSAFQVKTSKNTAIS